MKHSTNMLDSVMVRRPTRTFGVIDLQIGVYSQKNYNFPEIQKDTVFPVDEKCILAN